MNKNKFDIWLDKILNNNDLYDYYKKEILFLPFEKYKYQTCSNNKFTVYEDWWIRKPEIIKSKIISIVGKCQRIYARKCIIRKINKNEADSFLNFNHIYGSTKSKKNLALFYKDSLVAVATFAAQRNFSTGKSAEMLRFCNKNYTITVGGLSKLLKAYIKLYEPDNIMTYVDADWGNGSSFKLLGFNETGRKEKIRFYCNRLTGKRIPDKYFDDYENLSLYETIYNSGSIKLIL